MTDDTNVLMLSKSLALGGVETSVARIARGLLGRGLSVRVILPEVPASPTHPDLISWFGARGVVAETSPAFKVPGSPEPSSILALAKVLRQRRVDVVNVHFGSSSIPLRDVLAVRLAGMPCVASLHNCDPLSRLVARRTRLAALLCRRIIVGSSALRKMLLDIGTPAAKTSVISAGVPAPTVVLTRNEARERIGIATDAYVVICVARLVRNKGLDFLISALERVHDHGPHVHLVVVGDGKERRALEETARQRLAGRAHFLGFLENPDLVYPAADILVLPTLMEGAPLVPKEAAHFAVPSIATDVGGVRESIVDGETGLIVPGNDVPALACAIQKLVDDDKLRRGLGENAKLRVQRDFSEPAMIDAYAEVLRGRQPPGRGHLAPAPS